MIGFANKKRGPNGIKESFYSISIHAAFSFQMIKFIHRVHSHPPHTEHYYSKNNIKNNTNTHSSRCSRGQRPEGYVSVLMDRLAAENETKITEQLD